MPYPRKVKNVDYETMYRLYVTEQKSSGEIAKMYGVTSQPVLDRLSELGIPKRNAAEHNALRSHKDVNENFFSEWSPEMAYVLGWVLSDGNLESVTGNLRIAITDEEVLHKIASVMGLTNGVRTERTMHVRRKQPIYILSICRQQMYSDLVRLGVKPGNRTYDQPAIEVPSEYRRHFVRGFFDGDGSLVSFTSKRKKTPYHEIVLVKASKDFVDCLHDMVVEETGVYVSRCNQRPTAEHPIYRLTIGAKQSVLKMYHWMYEDVENQLWLERKHKKFVDAFGPLGEESDAV